jgi:lipoprotein-anchoring transpeptidase ErfK/SrfK
MKIRVDAWTQTGVIRIKSGARLLFRGGGPMRVLAICLSLMLLAGTASAQDCGPFFWLCQRPAGVQVPPDLPSNPGTSHRTWDATAEQTISGTYGRAGGEVSFFGQRSIEIDPRYMRRAVYYPSAEQPGTIIVDAQNHFLYLIEGSGRAIRYGIGVGRQGFSWSGVATVRDKQEWPDWYPPREMFERKPELLRQVSTLQSGLGMRGGPDNPLGARALYLWQGNKDTLYRIHGTNEPETIGTNLSSGCIRMLNQDVIELYQRTPLGAKVVVLASDAQAAARVTGPSTFRSSTTLRR